MSPADVSAVIVTRGGYDISEVLGSLADFGEVIVWDNSREQDLAVYGRFAAAMRSSKPVIYTQDDDCVTDPAAIVAEYEPGAVVCNWNARHREVNGVLYRGGIAPVGWGAVFDRSCLSVLAQYFDGGGEFDDLFKRECDRVFTALNQVKVIDVPVRNLPHAETGMWREQQHLDDLSQIRQRIAGFR